MEVGVFYQGKKALSNKLLQGFKIMGHDVRSPKNPILNCSILRLKQPMHERENILFIALYLWCRMAVQYLSVDPDWGLYIFLYYVCVLMLVFGASISLVIQKLQRKHAIICKLLNRSCTGKIHHD